MKCKKCGKRISGRGKTSFCSSCCLLGNKNAKGQVSWNKGLRASEDPRVARHANIIDPITGKPFNYKGGRIQTGAGYVKKLAKGHPSADRDGYVLEHRLVMEEKLGRLLNPWEKVHHKNAIRPDNRIENLEIVTNQKHYGNIVCPYCNKRFKIK